MSDKKTPSDGRAKPGEAREDRLKSALKANLAKRKAQAKARGAGTDKTNTGDKAGE
ncbi:hypothetical protein OB2597_05910 [Pseudooceanicola batsensis HTCC2597]|uniref:Uncharacterized protein n=1 Tax=Pseudooceanicola batsensis (strain ATCC BAA-863 / DSM 15984 / KCTC 12145 / HTCC2597) TaxID=252305 RepID=A3TT17_PSEBH|nr:hypothetical protein [Pseudooceanicola batsensis]EAQ04794.1 hypothetical protein OB2597_05910 [Pseudooceanicola batsensis HTCC2597]